MATTSPDGMRVSEDRLWFWVGIVGSRALEGSEDAREFIRTFIRHTRPGRVVSGRSPGGGIDIIAVEVARELGYEEWEIIEHLPEDSLVGPKTRENWINALFARNTLIARDCDVLLAITVPGGSNGTRDTVTKALRMGKPVIQVEFDAPSVS